MREAKEKQEQKQRLDLMQAEVKIDFRPQKYKPGEIAQLCGEMTEGIPVNMQPVGDQRFQLKVRLARGFKYRFWFLYAGQKELDYAHEVTTDHEGQPTNLIYAVGVNDGDDEQMEQVNLSKLASYNDDLMAKVDNIQFDCATQEALYSDMIQHEALIASIREYQVLIEMALNRNDSFEKERLFEKMRGADREFR